MGDWSHGLRVAVGVWALSLVCVGLSQAAGEAATIWLANAFVVGMWLRAPRPSVLVHAAATLAGFAATALVTGLPWQSATVLGFSNGVEIVLAIAGMRLVGIRHQLDPDERDFFLGVPLVVVLAPAAAALVRVQMLGVTGGPAWRDGFFEGWMADALGMLALLPVMWAASGPRMRQLLAGPKGVEFVVWLVGAVGLAMVALTCLARPFSALTLPMLVAAYRLGLLPTSVINLTLIVVIVCFGASARAGVNAWDVSGDIAGMSAGLLALYTGLSVMGALLVSVLVQGRQSLAGWWRTVADNVPVLIGYIGADRRCRFANRDHDAWLGSAGDALLGRLPAGADGSLLDAHLAPYIAQALAGAKVRFDVDLPGGRAVDASYIPHGDADGHVDGFFVLASDVSDRRAMERALHRDRDLLHATLVSIGDAVVVVDPQMHITLLNPVAEALTGWTQAEAAGRPAHDVLQLVDTLAGPMPCSSLLTALQGNRTVSGQMDCMLLHRDGRQIPVEETASPIRGPDGEVIGAVVVVHDVSESHAMASRLAHMAQHDHLTDLPNRVLLQDRLAQALAQSRAGEQGAVLFVDLDHFKTINDSLGHHVGDAVLREVARRLQATLRADDTVSRQGGDEFVVLLRRIREAADVARVCDSIIDAIEAPFEHEGRLLQISASVGVALFPQHSGDQDELLKQADTALYHAKAAGRARHCYFAREMSDKADHRLQLEHELRHALAHNALSLAWQPKVSADLHRVVGMEVLARWTRMDGVAVPPIDFIGLAESTGLITVLDEWVLGQACRQVAAWRRAGLEPGVVAVNVSIARLDPDRLLRYVDALMTAHDLPHGLLELELTESHMFEQPQAARRLVEALKARGVRVALDDFGTGHSNLGSLADVPFDTLKIDRSFVDDLPGNPKRAAVVRAIVGVARALGCEVVAEGVETPAQSVALTALGCDVMQGYLFAHPLDADHMQACLLARPVDVVGFSRPG